MVLYVVDYLCCMWHKYYYLCNYLITLFNPLRGISVRSSDVLCNSKSVGYIYILLTNLNSDDVVMSRGNLKFSLTPFCKRWGVIQPIYGTCPHNMYPIMRVISNSGQHNDTIIISAEKHIYNKTCCLHKRVIMCLSV
jgi:hypothetical protein